jgi:hypothetical protein
MDGRVDQDHLEFIMRHQHQGMGMLGFPLARSDSEVSARALWVVAGIRSISLQLNVHRFGSQEAPGSSESEPAAARPRGKRARAAEVHNLSEKVI